MLETASFNSQVIKCLGGRDLKKPSLLIRFLGRFTGLKQYYMGRHRIQEVIFLLLVTVNMSMPNKRDVLSSALS